MALILPTPKNDRRNAIQIPPNTLAFPSAMLSCCYCHGEITEKSPHCPSCKLTLDGLTKALGPVPLLKVGITDSTAVLSKKDHKQISKIIREFEANFHDTQLNILFYDFVENFNLSSQLFWLFNVAGLASEEQTQGRNRDILIGIDPRKGRAGITIGYGLEILLNKTDLEQLLEEVKSLLEEGSYVKAIKQLSNSLLQKLKTQATEFQQAFGLESLSTTKGSTKETNDESGVH